MPDSAEDASDGSSVGEPETCVGSADSTAPSLVWTGDGYGLAWSDPGRPDAEIHFAHLDETGAAVGEAVRLADAAEQGAAPSLVWTGSGYGVAWSWKPDWPNDEIYFAALDEEGALVDDEVQVTSAAEASLFPSLVWTGREYGIAWVDHRDDDPEILFRRVDEVGALIGDEALVATIANIPFDPSLVWTGSGYGVAWVDHWTIYFARFDEVGAPTDPALQVTAHVSQATRASFVWTGSGYGMAWDDVADGNLEVFFARLDDAGALVGEVVRVTDSDADSRRPSLVWTGGGYGMAWSDDCEDSRCEIYFVQLDEQGATVDEERRVTDSHEHSFDPSLVWTGSSYAVAWARWNGDGPGICFATITP